MSQTMKPFFYGCDFDPNPDINGLRRKFYTFLQRQESADGPLWTGPYEFFKETVPLIPKFSSLEAQFVGKFAVPSWVSATPDFQAEILPEMYRDFINQGQCRMLAEEYGQYLAANLPQDGLPVSIGVDHCLTGGVYQAFNNIYGELALLVFDMHLDAICPSVRNGMVGYHMEQQGPEAAMHQYEYYGEDFTGNYDTGSFLYYLLQEGILKGQNLFVIGVQDPPGGWLNKIDDKRVHDYLKSYAWLKEQGVTIIDLQTLNKPGLKSNLASLAHKLAGRNLYLSIDIDVFGDSLGQSARYPGPKGISFSKYMNLIQLLGLSEAKLVGLDLMELDVNSLSQGEVRQKDIVNFLGNLLLFTLKEKTAG